MPIGSIESPPSASFPRDCSHECRVCRVTVMGLSTYAKHISSQLHKDKVDALDKEEEKEEEEDEEEYFDKELIQLINQRKEQSRQDEACNSSKHQETDRYRRRDDRLSYQGQQEWHRDPSERNWQWQNECFNNSRQGFMHPALNHKSSRHLICPRGRAGWHSNSQPNRHLVNVNVGGSWHSNAGGATSWHHRGTGRNFHWHQEGNGGFPNHHPRNSGMWQPNPYNSNQWNFGGNVDTFPQGRNRPQRHCDNSQEQEPGWTKNNCTSNTYGNERLKWKKYENKPSNDTLFTSNKMPSKRPSDFTNDKQMDDFTSDRNIEDNCLYFNMSDNSDVASKIKPVFCPEKNSAPSRDRTHRWSPYPSQKVNENETVPQSTEKCEPAQVGEAKNKDQKKVPDRCLSKVKGTGEKDVPNRDSKQFEGKNNSYAEIKSSHMPLLKSTARNMPEFKSSTVKRDQKNPLKGVKLQSLSFTERQSRLSALNLETIRSSSYISKLRSASKNTRSNQVSQERNVREPAETLSEVLRKAKEILCSGQSTQNPYLQSLSDSSRHSNTRPSKVFKQSGASFDDNLEDVSDDELFSNEANVDNTLESNTNSANFEAPTDNSTKPKEQECISHSTLFSLKLDDKFISQNNPEPLNGDFNTNSHQSQVHQDTESFVNVSDLELQKGATHSCNTILPELSKLGLPASLQRDLTRHISARTKTGVNLPEPNLNSARRIRNLSGHRKSEADKDSGLKPTLRQILNASRRNVNWEQVMQQVTKKRQELGKGLPRFGIEMVAQVQSEQDGLDFDEETDLGIESYHWESISTSPLGSTRKRSLSESSVAVEKASVYDIFNDYSSDRCGEQSIQTRQPTPTSSGTNVGFRIVKLERQEDEIEENASIVSPAVDATVLPGLVTPRTLEIETGNVEICAASDSLSKCQSEDIVYTVTTVTAEHAHVDGGTDSCTSGTEQNDTQGVGKKRRATGDGSCPETSNLERNSKRRKLRGRKERSQVDQLLSISLQEEELNNSILGVDNSLLQARAALQAAYIEVQRLMVLKQQITMEMGTMRTQRIQILQGLQGTYEPVNNGEQTSTANPGNVFSFSLETPPLLPVSLMPSSTLLPAPVPVYTPPAVNPARAIPDSSITIKQEPMTPERIEEHPVTPSPPPLPPPEDDGGASQNTSVYPIITATMSLSELTSKFPVISEAPSLGRPTVSTGTSPVSFSSPKFKIGSTKDQPLPAQCGSRNQDLPVGMSPQDNSCSTGLTEQGDSTLITIETKTGKKKKLRKKKMLRATCVPENSDTEQDIYACKPVRKVRCRRPSKETIVSTSTAIEQEIDTALQEAQMNKDDNDSDSNIEGMEIRNPRFEVVEIDTHSEDEKPDSPSKIELADFVRSSEGTVEKHDEVTSTSELGTNFGQDMGKITNMRRTSPRGAKITSEVSSEPGEDEEPTEGNFEGHQASVNAIQIFDGMLYTCSADKSVRVYNLVTRQCEGVFEGHTSKVNCLTVNQASGKHAVLYTGSSDHTIRCFSIKTRECIEVLRLQERVLCLHVRWKILYAGLANGTVVTFSTKNNKQIDVFECHGPRAVSCMATAQEGARRLLLVGSYDCTISVRDARNGLLLRTLEGHTKTVLCMKVVNDLVFSGSSDQSVHAHNIHTGELVRIYKGHNHAVTVVNILGKVMVTACLDKFVRVYELQSHDRLQVYGGHSDMIMCMAIHKSMIYTGCYDGSVQAVRLNLMQNYRCWWHGCSLIFGVVDHLKQHLLTDHTNPHFQTLKCRWKNCDSFFTARRGTKQDAVGHIERHAEDDSRINI